ncbi:MAG: iron-containing alcohol dehydrogenase [Lachnospiraceae bacterium]
MTFEFNMPSKVVVGKDAFSTLEAHIKKQGKHAFIVTGKHVTKSGLVQRITDELSLWGVGYTVFNDITGEPTDQMIQEGIAAFEASGSDFCIALGGGSPLDSAKAIVSMSVLKGDIAAYAGKEIEGEFPPLIAIPTTAGTGSEATKFTIITDTQRNIKMLLKGNALLPQTAVLDYSLTISAPKAITAATGMDALTHAVESYTSKKANPMTDLYALSAVRRIFEYLPRAYKDGADETAREEMLTAAFEAGVCINNASVTLVHGMSRPIGALFHVPHGISNAMLISKCLGFALDGAYERFAQLAYAIEAADTSVPEQEAAGSFLAALDRLCAVCEIPTLAEYGIAADEFMGNISKMAQDALDSGSPGNTRKEVHKEDIVELYQSLW